MSKVAILLMVRLQLRVPSQGSSLAHLSQLSFCLSGINLRLFTRFLLPLRRLSAILDLIDLIDKALL